MAAPKKPISLLPKQKFDTATGRVFSWVLNAGRAIVIITELLVIFAFLSRFWLDRTLADLNDQVESRVASVNSFTSFERDFRLTQAKLTDFSRLSKLYPNFGESIDKIVKSVPPEVALIQITVEQQKLAITGTTLSEGGIEAFINNLSKRNLGDVRLSGVTIASEKEIGIRFIITIDLKKEAPS